MKKAIALVVLCALSVLLSGCVTSKKYRLATKDAPPVQPLNWPAEKPAGEAVAVDATLETLITYKGPGSWKREAKWDEYVLRLSNPGAQAITFESAELIDLQEKPQLPGVDPWMLEKMSYTNWERYGSSGVNLLAGAGWVGLYTAASFGAAMGSLMAPAGAAAGGGAALAIIPVVAVVNVTYVVAANHSNKKKVVAEFSRRRMSLPLSIAAGETRSGSLFFPMTPGPKRLVLTGTSDGRPVSVTIGLAPLARLHIRPGKT